MENKRIMFYGPSGTGKTTMANYISRNTGIPFISGSISDLIPKTKDMTHLDMMERDYKKIYIEDMQLLNLRSKLFKNEKTYVTDRSYLDIFAYHLIKVSKSIPECDSDALLQNITAVLLRDCTHIIFVPFMEDMIKNWNMEDNNKRVLNRYFQWYVSQVMYGLLRLLGYKNTLIPKLTKGANIGEIYPEKIYRDLGIDQKLYKPIKVLVLNTSDFNKRNEIIEYFLNK